MPLPTSTEALERLSAILAAAGEGIVGLDREGRCTLANPSALEMTGWTADDLLGRSMHEVLHHSHLDGRPYAEADCPVARALVDGDVRRVSGEVLWRRDGTSFPVEYTATPLRDEEGVSGAVVVFRDVSERERAQRAVVAAAADQAARLAAEEEGRRASFLARVGIELDAELGVEERLARVTRLVVAEVADYCTVRMIDAGGALRLVAFAHRDPATEERLRTLRARAAGPPMTPAWVTRTFQTGQPELVALRAGCFEQRFDPLFSEVLSLVDAHTVICVPLVARGRTLGTLSLVRGSRPGAGAPLDTAGVGLAESIARRAALAIDNARLFEAAEVARDRVSRLLRVTSALSASLTLEEVAKVIVGEGMSALDAAAGLLALRDGDEAVTVCSAGYPEEITRRYARFPLDAPIPLADSIRGGSAVWLEGIAEWRRRYRPPRSGHEGAVSIPLNVGGRTIGGVAFRFHDRRHFDEGERAFVLTLAEQCALALERARLYADQREIADTLQQSLLPAALPDVPGLSIAAVYEPAGGANQVGGDFYDVFEDGPALVAVMGDVVGKGPDAAALTALVRHTLRAIAPGMGSPADLLRRLNQAITGQRRRRSMFCTAVLARFEPDGAGRRVTVASAGHPLPVLVPANGPARGVGVPGSLLGPFDEVSIEDRSVTVAPGDALVLYTDGVTEARGAGGLFGEERLRALLDEVGGAEPGEIVSRVRAGTAAHRRGSPADDVAILAIRADA